MEKDTRTRTEQARQQLALRQAEVSQAESALAAAERELAQALEAQAREDSAPGSDFAQKWARLLDSVQAHNRPNHYDELRAELLAVAGERKALLVNSSGRIRRDNRQVLLQLLVPRDDEHFERLYLFLLALAPQLCNRANPQAAEQSAMLDVMTRDLSDKESLTLLVDPDLGRHEAVLSSRFDEQLLVKADSLRELLEFVRMNHPYH